MVIENIVIPMNTDTMFLSTFRGNEYCVMNSHLFSQVQF